MHFLPFLHFFSCLVYLYLAIYIVIKNPRALLNRSCSVFTLCFAIWSFTMIFVHNPDIPKDTVILSRNIGCFGWVSFSSFCLWFILIFTEKKRILKRKPLYIILFILPPIFIYKQWTNFLLVDYTKQYYGWSYGWSESIWPPLFYLYYCLFMGIALYLLFDFKKKTKSSIKKKQAGLIFTTAIITLVLGSFLNIILPELKIYAIPDIANVIILIWAVALVYAITKYEFLSITPAIAADNILSTMSDSLILLDAKEILLL